MIWQANVTDKPFTFTAIFLGCLKFWDSTLLVKAYFGGTSTDELLKRVDDKRQQIRARRDRRNVLINPNDT